MNAYEDYDDTKRHHELTAGWAVVVSLFVMLLIAP